MYGIYHKKDNIVKSRGCNSNAYEIGPMRLTLEITPHDKLNVKLVKGDVIIRKLYQLII